MTKTYDAFISYSTRRDRMRARALAKYLAAAGYSIWFDEAVLGRRSRPTPVPKEDVCAWLQAAIAESRCVLLHLIQAEALLLGDLDVERALESKQVMYMTKDATSPQLIAWNWQTFEVSHAEHWINVSGRKPEEVAESLAALGILPAPRPTTRRPFFTARLRSLARWIRRRNRVRRLFTAFKLDRAEAEECAVFMLDDAASAVASNFGMIAAREGIPRVVVFSESRRMTELTGKLAAHLAQFYASRRWEPGLSIYMARLPAEDDLATWSEYLRGFPPDSLFLITDPVETADEPDAQRLYYYERVWERVWASGRNVVFCVTRETKEALVNWEYPQQSFDPLRRIEFASVPSRLLPQFAAQKSNCGSPHTILPTRPVCLRLILTLLHSSRGSYPSPSHSSLHRTRDYHRDG